MVNRVTKRLDNSSSLQTEVVRVGNNALLDWGVRGSAYIQCVFPTVSPPDLSDLHFVLRSKTRKSPITMATKRDLKLWFMGNYYNFRNINSCPM
ncbi:hypothetical protein BKA91DRAFT_153323 [Yarrowia lipolytica]|nr:hypothetical protein BKA91DRAFT_153323 [Yarrowia lipolytica]KAE8170418.1 hypothetical protein BKA90DRAFT_154429 [Yarrowia lipolytica]RMI97113.1 hypothetical protein BD777DRAFT_142179 [Yarrowia lipolytica]